MKSKKTGRRITEKPARMPEIRELEWKQRTLDYFESIKQLQSEPARSHRFLLLLNDLFGIQPGFIEDYVAGIEKYVKVKQKDRILRGKVDNLFGNLIIEFERDLVKKQTEAYDQLRKYVACIWSNEKSERKTPYLCIASDGINFIVYSPLLINTAKEEILPEDIQLNAVDEQNLTAFEPNDVYFWLDRYFLRKEILAPKSEDIVKDFGVKSHAFQITSRSLLSAWNNLKTHTDFKVIYEAWQKYLRVVYGTEVAEDELFCRHTYLATLAKLMAWSRLNEGKLDNGLIVSVLSGHFFREQGIENFLEEDFFSWIVREDVKRTGIESARMLLSLLKNYNLRELSEDVLKSLYQELVDPKTRHDLGEFYTPDWLAHRMVKKLLDNDIRASVLDPSCGSGTFLYLTIREKRARLRDTSITLGHILSSVCGVDIHPLAVITAKTNYILALGDLVKKRKRKISIPIYLSDAIRLPEREVKPTLWVQIPSYRVKLNDKIVHLPEKLIEIPSLYDEAVDAANEFARQNAKKQVTNIQFQSYLKAQHPDVAINKDVSAVLFQISQTLKEFIEDQRDTIWAFILKNSYKPLFLKRKFDIVIGNPPWLAFRFAEPGYQKFLREQITKNYNILAGRGELISHLELGTLFLLRTADLYLKENGTIGFVLPRSIFTGDQHDGLRKGSFVGMNIEFDEIWDLEEVSPLFNIPACVLIAQKKLEAKVLYPISGQKISGKIDQRNASFDEAQKFVSTCEVQYFLHKRGKRSFWATEEGKFEGEESYYKKLFYQGATIVPRSFWFVEVKSSSLGFDPSCPPLESSERAKKEAKEAYKGLVMQGNVESQFLYATLLSTDLLPFGHLDYRLVVLPIEPSQDHYRLITADEALRKGFLNLAEWLQKAQVEWERRRGAKARSMSIYERLDRYRGLTKQGTGAGYRILYNTSGTFLCACFVENKTVEFDIEGQKMQHRGIIADTKTYCFETNDCRVAQYLSAVLNAPSIDRLLKPMQSRGQWGPRDIHKKVLELPIPGFMMDDPRHLHLAELGRKCTTKVARWVESGEFKNMKSIGRIRQRVREMLKKELGKIDNLVQQILETK